MFLIKILNSLRCIARELVLTGRLPFVCYSTKAKTETFQAECCNEDFCNDNISHRPEPESGRNSNSLLSTINLYKIFWQWLKLSIVFIQLFKSVVSFWSPYLDSELNNIRLYSLSSSYFYFMNEWLWLLYDRIYIRLHVFLYYSLFFFILTFSQ
jgi:hypothetical protein